MRIVLTFVLIIVHLYISAQSNSTDGIHFQAIARNTDGSIIPEKNITIRLSIIEGTSEGKITYQEIKRVKTNIVGMFSVVLGANEHFAIVVNGAYKNINWYNTPTYIRVEVDPEGGINFLNLGIQKMNSVPYALVANSIQFQNVNGLDTILKKKMNLSDTSAMLASYQKKEFSSLNNISISGDVSGTNTSSIVTGINGKKLANLETGILKNNTLSGVPSIAIAGQDYIKPNGSASDLTNFPIFNQNTSGNAATATIADTAIIAVNITTTTNSTLTTLPNLASVGIISSGTWSGSVVDIGHGGTGTNQLSGLLLGSNESGINYISTAAYGSWYDNSTQVAALANTAYPMAFNSQDFAQGVAIINNTKITVSKSGKYNLQFSAQLDRSAGTSTEYVSIWLRKNGLDIPATCTDITIQGGTLVAATVAAWNFFQNLNANDNIEIMWSTTSANIQIQYLPARTNPIRPIIPSIILTVQQIY